MAASYNSSQRRTPQYNDNNNDTSADQSLSIFVGNLPFNISEGKLAAFFNAKCGDVKKVIIIYDRKTGNNRRFGFLYFNTLDAYNAAFELSECRLDGQELRIGPGTKNSFSPSSTITTTTTKAPTGAATFGARQTTKRSKTQVVHCKKSNYDVYIGRPTDWGNPFVIGKDGDRADVIRKYRDWIMLQPDLLARAKKELRGQTIACWCKPEACHGDILAEIADAD
jgi:RNA recognition motif-containing protein